MYSYHKAVCEVCRGGARLKGLLGGCRHGPLIGGTQGHQRGSRHDATARVVIVPKFFLTEL